MFFLQKNMYYLYRLIYFMKRSLFILSILFFSINLLIAENKNGTPSIVRRTCGTERPSEQWSQDFQQKVVQFVAQHQNNSQNRIIIYR